MADSERLRDTIDSRVRAGEISAKTGQNIWSAWRTASKAASGRWGKRDKRKTLQVRDDDPCKGVIGPDYDPDEDCK